MRRVVLVAAGLAGLFLVSFGVFLACGWLTPEWTRELLEGFSPAAVAALLFALLASDLVLPVPSSVAVSVAGILIGWVPAALAGSAGMLAGNLAGYWLCRLVGARAFERFVKPEEAGRFGRWLNRWGPGALVVSRLVPVMAETLSCLAGLGKMRFGPFLTGLVVGTVPFALFFALVGDRLGRAGGEPGLALLVALAVPAAGWVLFAALARRSRDS
jgi:uncharacterized membrane protein YdjX (TVP38/TMEM64 family)